MRPDVSKVIPASTKCSRPHARIGRNYTLFIMTTGSVPGTLFSALKSKIEARQARVAVIGLGYVGLPLALLYTEQKFPVTGFDIDQRKVTALARGGSYIYRIPATEIAWWVRGRQRISRREPTASASMDRLA